MKLIRHYGALGLYVLLLGSLSRHLLDAPRTVGIRPTLLDLFLVFAASVVSVLILNYLYETWKQVLNAKGGRNNFNRTTSTLRRRLWITAIGSLIVMVLGVAIDLTPALRPYTPYHLCLFFVSMAGAILVESLLKIAGLRVA